MYLVKAKHAKEPRRGNSRQGTYARHQCKAKKQGKAPTQGTYIRHLGEARKLDMARHLRKSM
jgi:hypothetical protein